MSEPDLPVADATADDALVEQSDNSAEEGADTPSQDPNWDPNEGQVL